MLKNRFRDADAPNWGVAGVLDLMKELLDSVTPEAGVLGFEIFDQLCDLTPDGVPCDVGVYSPRVVYPVVDDLVEDV